MVVRFHVIVELFLLLRGLEVLGGYGDFFRVLFYLVYLDLYDVAFVVPELALFFIAILPVMPSGSMTVTPVSSISVIFASR